MVNEVGSDPSWDEILRFTTNILGTDDLSKDMRYVTAQSTYFSSAAQVLVARRLDEALGVLQQNLTNAAQHVGKVSERGTSLLVESAQRQAAEAEKHARSLKHATWALTVVTTILAAATVALALFTRNLVAGG